MTKSKLPSIVYHATLLRHLESIQQKIKIHRENALINLDFGKGFYTTSNFQQAENRARLLQERHRNPVNKVLSKLDRGIIITFDLDVEMMYTLPNEQRVHFTKTDVDWAKYIVFNRFTRTSKTPHNYKWTYGSLADGKELRIICKKFIKHQISSKELLAGIRPYSENFDQLSFHEDEDFVNSALAYRDFTIINPHAVSKGG